MDSGSSQSFINPQLVELHGLPVHPSSGIVSLASAFQSTQIQGYCTVNLALMGCQYNNICLYVLPSLCADLILGLDFQTQHQSVTLNYGGKEAPLNLVGGLSSLNVKSPELFANLTADCHPIASKSRQYSFANRQFIEKEMKRLLEEGIITRVPFGVTNGVAYFQRKMDELVSEEELKGTFAYLDDVTICGMTQE